MQPRYAVTSIAALTVAAVIAIVIRLEPSAELPSGAERSEASTPLTGGMHAPSIVDHHVHVMGPVVLRDWKSLGVTFSRADSIYTSARSLLIGRGDSVAQAVLVPMAHLYANPDFVAGLKIDAAEARRRLRLENSHVASEAARLTPRAVALCSVPALAEWAIEELTWCQDSLRVAGIKLHLASSQVDLRDTIHLRQLSAIARFAASRALPILLHLDPQRRGHDAEHIRRFAEWVLQPVPTLTVVIAHLGGSGGYGPWTRTVFRTLLQWRADVEKTGTSRSLYFDVSAVVLDKESEGVPATTPAEAAMLRQDLRSISFDRLVFGSDYPVFDPIRARAMLLEIAGLTEDEVARMTRGVEGGIFRRGD
ncbi:MAG: amidohydrolase family protein [Gemmatimonadaceae bacterium]|nr:amidohydrolase family protein [Gemmatimonadaceae bacterium]